MCAGRLFHSETEDQAVQHSAVEEPVATTAITSTMQQMQQMQQIASSEAVEAAAMASKYRKYERDYLRRINHLYFSSSAPDNSGTYQFSLRCVIIPPLLVIDCIPLLSFFFPFLNFLFRRFDQLNASNDMIILFLQFSLSHVEICLQFPQLTGITGRKIFLRL